MTRVRITLHRDGSLPAVLDLRDTDPVTTVHRGIITAGHLREGDRLAWGESHRVWRVTRTTLIETVTA